MLKMKIFSNKPTHHHSRVSFKFENFLNIFLLSCPLNETEFFLCPVKSFKASTRDKCGEYVIDTPGQWYYFAVKVGDKQVYFSMPTVDRGREKGANTTPSPTPLLL
jgi:hypothetical protein